MSIAIQRKSLFSLRILQNTKAAVLLAALAGMLPQSALADQTRTFCISPIGTVRLLAIDASTCGSLETAFSAVQSNNPTGRSFTAKIAADNSIIEQDTFLSGLSQRPKNWISRVTQGRRGQRIVFDQEVFYSEYVKCHAEPTTSTFPAPPEELCAANDGGCPLGVRWEVDVFDASRSEVSVSAEDVVYEATVCDSPSGLANLPFSCPGSRALPYADITYKPGMTLVTLPTAGGGGEHSAYTLYCQGR